MQLFGQEAGEHTRIAGGETGRCTPPRVFPLPLPSPRGGRCSTGRRVRSTGILSVGTHVVAMSVLALRTTTPARVGLVAREIAEGVRHVSQERCTHCRDRPPRAAFGNARNEWRSRVVVGRSLLSNENSKTKLGESRAFGERPGGLRLLERSQREGRRSPPVPGQVLPEIARTRTSTGNREPSSYFEALVDQPWSNSSRCIQEAISSGDAPDCATMLLLNVLDGLSECDPTNAIGAVVT